MKKGLNSLSFSCLTMHHFGIPSFALSISGFNVLLHFIFFFFLSLLKLCFVHVFRVSIGIIL